MADRTIAAFLATKARSLHKTDTRRSIFGQLLRAKGRLRSADARPSKPRAAAPSAQAPKMRSPAD